MKRYVPDNITPDRLYDRQLNVEYGYVVGVGSTDENPRYLVLVKKEFSYGVDGAPVLIPVEEPAEVLASTYGRPEDLIGQRVRVEYFGTNWRTGVARIVPSRDIPSRPGLTDIPSRGFRYAVAGGGGEE